MRVINKLYEESDLEIPEWKMTASRLDQIVGRMRDMGFQPNWHRSRPWEWTVIVKAIEAEVIGKSRILDVGAGRSPLPFLLSQLGHDVWCLDIRSPEPYVDLPFYFENGIKYLLWDASSGLPFGEDEFDFVVSSCVLEHIDAELDDIVSEFLRVSSIGTANTVDIVFDAGRFLIDELANLLRQFNMPSDYRFTDEYFLRNFPVFNPEDRPDNFAPKTCASLVIRKCGKGF